MLSKGPVRFDKARKQVEKKKIARKLAGRLVNDCYRLGYFKIYPRINYSSCLEFCYLPKDEEKARLMFVKAFNKIKKERGLTQGMINSKHKEHNKLADKIKTSLSKGENIREIARKMNTDTAHIKRLLGFDL